MMKKTYNELIQLDSFDDRIEYLKLSGIIGEDTFGHSRYLNQEFYRSRKWKQVRDIIIIRDNACDLGIDGYDIYDMILVHHINPIVVQDIIDDNEILYDINNLICTSKSTHDYIHYGKKRFDDKIIQRKKNDTSPWL